MGDILSNGDVLKCIVKSDCKNNIARLIRIKKLRPQGFTPVSIPQGFTPVSIPQGFEDLLITPWHPVKIGGHWQYPAEREGAQIEEINCEAVYSLLVTKDENENENERNNKIYCSDSGTFYSPINCYDNKDNDSNVDINVNNNSNNNYNNNNDDNNNNSYNNDSKYDNDNNKVNGIKHPYSSIIVINGIKCATLAHGILNQNVISHPFFGTLKVEKELRQCKGWSRGFIHFGVHVTSLFLHGQRDNLTSFDPVDMTTNSHKFSNYDNNDNDDDSNGNYVGNDYNTNNDGINNNNGNEFSNENKILIKSKKYSKKQSLRMYESCLVRDVSTGLATGFLLNMEL